MSAMEQPLGFAYEGIRSFCRMPMCFNPDQLEADVAVVGICFDTANFSRCGARYGPQAIREASNFMGLVHDANGGFFDSELGRNVLSGVDIVDCGDITVFPSLPVSFFQPGQSLSARPSSMLMMGYFRTQSA